MTTPATTTPIIELRDVSKSFAGVHALQDVSFHVNPGEVRCLLGDNGAGKSTLIQIISGVHRPTTGTIAVDGEEVRFTSTRDAMAKGIATVFQDLAVIPLMSVSRNFFLGAEPYRGWGPFKQFDRKTANRVALQQLREMGVRRVHDPNQLVGTLSGGQRQAVAICRAMYFGARMLILDEPTSALGVREASTVLRFVAKARRKGVGVVFITHNAHHAMAIGDRFTVLNHGRVAADFSRDEKSREEVLSLMAGGEELGDLTEELAKEFALLDAETNALHTVR